MIKDLETAIGYRFHNIQLLQNALTHSSYANERWHNSLLSNERLEFLGDSVLGMLVAEYLYRSFPDRPEGELTRIWFVKRPWQLPPTASVWAAICCWDMARSRVVDAAGNPFWQMPWNPSSPPASWTAAWRPR